MKGTSEYLEKVRSTKAVGRLHWKVKVKRSNLFSPTFGRCLTHSPDNAAIGISFRNSKPESATLTNSTSKRTLAAASEVKGHFKHASCNFSSVLPHIRIGPGTRAAKVRCNIAPCSNLSYMRTTLIFWCIVQ